MDAVLRFLAENGAMLLAGVTALLGLGCIATAVCRSPAHRQRVCEVSLLATLGWAVLACFPLPRVSWGAATPPGRRGTVGHSSLVTPNEIAPELIAGPADTAAPVAGAHVRNVEPVAHGAADAGSWAAVAYLSGSVVCVAWLVIGYGVIRRVIRHAEPAPAAVRAWAQPCANGWPVRILTSPRLAGPLTFGVSRPVILLPSNLLASGREGQLRQVVRHELSHVLRRDGWGNLLFCLALPALYFHPCYWWLRRSAEMARELVADDWAARSDGKDAYVSELVALARSRIAGSAGVLVGGIGMLRRRSTFYRRMRMLLQRSEPLATGCSRTWRATLAGASLMVVASAAALAGVRPVVAQVPPTATPPPAEQPAARPEATPWIKQRLVEPAEEHPATDDARKRLADLQARQRELETLLANIREEVDALTKRSQETPTKSDATNPYGDHAQGRPVGVNVPRPDAATLPPPGPAAAVGGVQLDLVNLANSLVDASGAYKQAQLAFDAKEKLSRSGAFNTLEIAEARARLETAQKRIELLRSIAQVAMESAKLNYARLKQLNSMGMVDNQAFDEAASKLKMLEVIVKGAE